MPHKEVSERGGFRVYSKLPVRCHERHRYFDFAAFDFFVVEERLALIYRLTTFPSYCVWYPHLARIASITLNRYTKTTCQILSINLHDHGPLGASREISGRVL